MYQPRHLRWRVGIYITSHSPNLITSTFTTRLTPYTPLPRRRKSMRHNLRHGDPQDCSPQPPAPSLRTPNPPPSSPPLQHLHNQKPILRNPNRIRASLPNIHNPGALSRCRTRIRIAAFLYPTPLLIPRHAAHTRRSEITRDAESEPDAA